MDTLTPVITDAAIFVGKSRQYTSIDVVVDGDTLRLMRNRRELDAYEIIGTVETPASLHGKAAWDVKARSEGETVRVQAVHGCGCGGRPKVTPNTEYGLAHA